MDAVEGFLLVLAALSAALYLTMVAGFLMAMRPTDSLRLAFLSAVVPQTAGAVATTRILRGPKPRWYWAPLEIPRSYLLFFYWLGAV